MTYGKMSTMDMCHAASASSADASCSCAHYAYDTVIVILDAIIMASIIICTLVTLLPILGISLLALLALVLLVGLLVYHNLKKPKARICA